MTEQSQRQFIRDNYDKMPVRHISKAIGRSRTFILGQLKREGLEIPEQAKRKFIEGPRFKKGRVPGNKGLRQSDYMSPDAIERTKATRFKKGQRSLNERENGALSIRKTHGRPYIWIRIDKGHWRMLHRVIWEYYHGPIPKSCNIQFKNGDFLDCGQDNLYAVHRKEQAVHNKQGGNKLPHELKETITLFHKIKSKINEK